MRALEFRKTINIGDLAHGREGRGECVRVRNRSLPSFLPRCAVSYGNCAYSPRCRKLLFSVFPLEMAAKRDKFKCCCSHDAPPSRSLSLSHTFDVMALGGKDGIGGRIGPATATAGGGNARQRGSQNFPRFRRSRPGRILSIHTRSRSPLKTKNVATWEHELTVFFKIYFIDFLRPLSS